MILVWKPKRLLIPMFHVPVNVPLIYQKWNMYKCLFISIYSYYVPLFHL